MGVSASIASKKYQFQDTGAQTEDNDDCLSSVDSFRPNSPWAHPQARLGTPNGHISTANPYVLGYYGHGVNNSQGGSVLSGPPFHSMHEIRDYLLHNPELLCNKKKKKVTTKDLVLPMEQRQMKTKQGVYLGLINPPVIYGAGVNPYANGGRIKVNQKLYLGLVYPTVSKPLYHEPIVRAIPPLRHPQEMMVVRRDTYNPQTSPKNIRQRKPLPPPESKKSEQRTNSLPRMGRGMVVERVTAQQGHRHATLPKSKGKPRTGSGLVETPDLTKKSPGVPVNSHRFPNVDSDGSISNTSTLNSQNSKSKAKRTDSKVEFTFNVDELNLRRRNRNNQFVERHADHNPMAPIHFRKSLAYSPKYDDGPELLSAPL